MNVLLINDSSSNPNWGDRAAAIALKRMITASGGTLGGVITELELYESRFFPPPEGESPPETGRRNLKDWAGLFLPPVVFKLREKIRNHLGNSNSADPIPLTLDEFDRCANSILQDRATFGGLIHAIETADVVVIHGNGCMVGIGLLPRSELFLSYLIKARFGKPVILINHTADFSHPELNRMAEAVYPILDDVTYRDQISADLCRSRWSGRYAADTAFLFEPAERGDWVRFAARPTYFDVWPDEASFDPAQPYICVGGSSLYAFETPPRGIIQGFKELVSHLKRVYSGQVILTASDGKDQNIFRPVAKALQMPLIGLSTPVQQAVDIIGNAQVYIGGRWHPSIFALRGGTPVIPISSKTFKMQSLIQMAGLPTSPIDAFDLKGAHTKIALALEHLLACGDSLRQALKAWASQQAATTWDNLEYLRQLPSISSQVPRQQV
jgi:polysaccharide pyruvyl transferase WcaK-like protein